MKDLLAYLYGGSQVESEVEETREAIERIMEEAEKQEPLKPKRTPLVSALKSLGLDDVNDEIEYDTEGFVLVCDEEDEYRRYVKILMEPDAMEKLAKLGWVVTRCGDVAMSNEAPEFRIRFLEITTLDPDDKESWPAPNPELIKNAVKKGREFMDEPGPHDDESPVEYDDKTSDNHKKGVGDAKDGADPEGKPKGSSKKESQDLVDQLLRGVNETDLEEGRHKDGCQCGFCKNMGKGFKKKDDSGGEEKEEPTDKTSGNGGSTSSGSGSSGSGTEATSVFKIEGCARCGQNHEHLIFERLDSPVRNLTHWAECPNTGQPILMRMVDDVNEGFEKGQKVRLKRGMWGHKPGTAGRIRRVLSPDDSQTKVNRYTAQAKFKGSPPMYIRPEDVDENLAQRRGRPKSAPKDKPIAKAPKASMNVAKAYKTPKK